MEFLVGRIISAVSCVLCSLPFFIIGKYDKDSVEPIGFWSGDTTLKDKVKDVKSYNKKMAALYIKCGIAFLINAVVFFIYTFAGIVLLIVECTVGIYVVWRIYKKILEEYSW